MFGIVPCDSIAQVDALSLHPPCLVLQPPACVDRGVAFGLQQAQYWSVCARGSRVGVTGFSCPSNCTGGCTLAARSLPCTAPCAARVCLRLPGLRSHVPCMPQHCTCVAHSQHSASVALCYTPRCESPTTQHVCVSALVAGSGCTGIVSCLSIARASARRQLRFTALLFLPHHSSWLPCPSSLARIRMNVPVT